MLVIHVKGYSSLENCTPTLPLDGVLAGMTFVKVALIVQVFVIVATMQLNRYYFDPISTLSTTSDIITWLDIFLTVKLDMSKASLANLDE